MLRSPILVLATAIAVGTAVLSTSASAFGPPFGGPPLGGPHFGGPPLGGPRFGGPPLGGPRFGGGHFGGPQFRGGHFGGGHFRGGYSERFAGHYGGSHYRRWGRYARGYGTGYGYGTYSYDDASGCYETQRYHTSTGWHTRRVYVCR